MSRTKKWQVPTLDVLHAVVVLRIVGDVARGALAVGEQPRRVRLRRARSALVSLQSRVVDEASELREDPEEQRYTL